MGGPRDLRGLLAADELLVMPGGFSPLHARMAERIGFRAFFVAGSQASVYLLGVPDVGVLGLRDMAQLGATVAGSCRLAVMLDGDTGYGNAVNVHFAVRELARTGVAAVQLEDQEAPKRSGTGSGRRCIDREEAVGKVRAAVAARDDVNPAMAICARCDAIGAEGETFETAVDRCRAYLLEGGADLVWLNSPQSLTQVEDACGRIPGPVLTSWGRPGPTPSLEEFASTGLKVLLVPTIAASAATQASWEVLHRLHRDGTAGLDAWSRTVEASPYGRVALGDLVGLARVRELEATFVPRRLQRDYDTTFGSSQDRTGEGGA